MANLREQMKQGPLDEKVDIVILDVAVNIHVHVHNSSRARPGIQCTAAVDHELFTTLNAILLFL